jgi:hypothetical protein
LKQSDLASPRPDDKPKRRIMPGMTGLVASQPTDALRQASHACVRAGVYDCVSLSPSYASPTRRAGEFRIVAESAMAVRHRNPSLGVVTLVALAGRLANLRRQIDAAKEKLGLRTV